MYRPNQDQNLDRHYDSPNIILLWKIVRHTSFVLIGMGIALFIANILGFHASAALFLITWLPVIFKALVLIGCFAFVMILVESFK